MAFKFNPFTGKFDSVNVAGTVEGTAVLSTGETGGTKFLREDGDGTSSWQALAGGGDLLAANNLSDVASVATAYANIKQAASSTATGAVELATIAEVNTGTDTARAITPAGLAGSTLYSTANSALQNVVEDTTPQLGANLDTNGFEIDFDDVKGINLGTAISLLTDNASHGSQALLVGGADAFKEINFPAGFGLNANTGLTGLGNYFPQMVFNVDGSVYLWNTGQGVAGDRKLDIRMAGGLVLALGGSFNSTINTTNVTASRLNEMPNSAGTLAVTSNTDGVITESDISDLGAYITAITGEPLSDLSDVTITAIASGEVLKWNGTAWINQTLAEAGIEPAKGVDDNFVTDAEKTVIGNTSGTNTGDQTTVSGTSGNTDALNSATTVVDVSAATAPTTGQVLTATSSTAATWQTAAGGGGQTLVTIVVDTGGGGDYTTIDAALTAASAGDTIYLTNGTHTLTGDLSSALTDLTIRGENHNSAKIVFGAYDITLSGANTTVEDLYLDSTAGTTGYLWMSGADQTVQNCKVYSANASYTLRFSSTNSIIRDNYIRMTNGYRSIQTAGVGALITGNYFDCDDVSDNTSFGLVDVLGDYSTFSANQAYVSSTAQDYPFLRMNGNYGSVLGNSFTFSSATEGDGIWVWLSGGNSNASANSMVGGAIGVKVTGNNGIVTGNYIKTDGGSQYLPCIYTLNSLYTKISNNYLTTGSSSYGITIDGSSSDSHVTNNMVVSASVGIHIDDTSASNVWVQQNKLFNCTTDFDDDGTDTVTDRPRSSTIASSATPTPAGDSTDQFTVTALAVGATFAAPTGTPTDGQKLTIRIKDNATAQTLAWNAIYRAIGVTLPTTTVISKTLYLGMVYNSADSKWDVLAVAQEA